MGDWDITVYAFGKEAEKYGEFLKEAGINEMPIWTCDLEEKPFARQLWFRYLDYGSDFVGGRDLGSGDRARGVRKVREAQQKILQSYTTIDLKNAEKNLQALRKIIQPEQLKDLESLLSKLKQ